MFIPRRRKHVNGESKEWDCNPQRSMTEILTNKINTRLKEMEQFAQSGREQAFLLLTTNNLKSSEAMLGPIRVSDHYVISSAIIREVGEADSVLKAVDGAVDVIFIDTEPKQIPDLFSRYSKKVAKSRVYPIKPNDITAEAADFVLTSIMQHDLQDKTIAVIGCGNIGAKFILRIQERAGRIVISSRRKLDNLIESLREIAPRHSSCDIVQSQDIMKDIPACDAITVFTPGVPVVTEEMLGAAKDTCVIMDSGIGNLSEEAIAVAFKRELLVFRLDIGTAVLSTIDHICRNESFVKKIKRNKIEDIWYVSGGMMGRRGDRVVDDADDPQIRYGIADGLGRIA